MKKNISLAFAVVLAASSMVVSAEVFNHVDLDKDRRSVEYSGPINKTINAIKERKWLGQTKDMDGGVVFTPYVNPQFGKNNTESGGAIMVTATFYLYDQPVKEALMVARQSQIPGFVEFYGYDSRELQMHIRMIDGDTFQSFASDTQYRSPEKLNTYKVVEGFNKSPYKSELKSVEESGMWY
ncbi:hypothetical protein [Pseudomonas sp. MF4836]|uniref:hypothetical protein n=1 Tax=Pseudomonas sp. MF4836 TaxID=1960827 RepID=UPI000996EAE9|nr:hypothetical protein [Pseudomonas sp. MF4836]OOV96168.1 hypothetical protein MF4836_13045 [Pseudomonas sp. MF4836]